MGVSKPGEEVADEWRGYQGQNKPSPEGQFAGFSWFVGFTHKVCGRITRRPSRTWLGFSIVRGESPKGRKPQSSVSHTGETKASLENSLCSSFRQTLHIRQGILIGVEEPRR